MINQHQNRAIRITRMNERELDAAIGDLEKRGWEVLSRGIGSQLRKSYSYHESSFYPHKYAGSEIFKQHWAVVRRKGFDVEKGSG